MTTAFPTRIETAIIGAGQAGLAMSALLRAAERDHVVLDRREQLGGGWRDRWDAFRLVSPAWSAGLLGWAYDGDDPDGFLPRDVIAGRVAAYADRVAAPVVTGTDVQRVTARPLGGFRLETSQGSLDADQVILATGGFHRPHMPTMAGELPARVLSLHSHYYRREPDLPPGGVLVVGSAQSGVQLAEELHAAGRDVYLAVGSAGRVPRRYRGRDIFVWLALLVDRGEELGVALPTADKLPHPSRRYAGNPHLSGHRGGQEINLRALGRGGITLLGRLEAIDGERVRLADDLGANLDFADRFFRERFQNDIDELAIRAGIDAPPAEPSPAVDFDPPIVRELDLADRGIGTVLWTSGYRQDWSWIEPPIADELGFARQADGVVTDVPGLFVIGSLWQRDQASATLFGVQRDARRLAARMGIDSTLAS